MINYISWLLGFFVGTAVTMFVIGFIRDKRGRPLKELKHQILVEFDMNLMKDGEIPDEFILRAAKEKIYKIVSVW